MLYFALFQAKLLSQVRHPNIVSYKESFQGSDGLLYIVMAFCEGGDMYSKLKAQKGKHLEEGQVVEWFVQIAMALQVCHTVVLIKKLSYGLCFLRLVAINLFSSPRKVNNECYMCILKINYSRWSPFCCEETIRDSKLNCKAEKSWPVPGTTSWHKIIWYFKMRKKYNRIAVCIGTAIQFEKCYNIHKILQIIQHNTT